MLLCYTDDTLAVRISKLDIDFSKVAQFPSLVLVFETIS